MYIKLVSIVSIVFFKIFVRYRNEGSKAVQVVSNRHKWIDMNLISTSQAKCPRGKEMFQGKHS